ncbi:MAG: hypothetical protein ACTHXB_04670 [Luteimonas sp.]
MTFALLASLIASLCFHGYMGSESEWRSEGWGEGRSASLNLLELIDEEGEFIDLRSGQLVKGSRLRGAGSNVVAVLFPDRTTYEIVFDYIRPGASVDVCNDSSFSTHSSGEGEYSVTVGVERSGEWYYSSISVVIEEFVSPDFGVAESLYLYKISCERKPYKLIGSFSAG